MAQDPRLLERAAQMRHEATPFEVILWRCLSRSQLGYKFRRQHVIGKYIVDFFCPAKSFAVEVDGDTHHDDVDEARDAALAELDVHMLRFSNEDVARNLEGVLKQIMTQLEILPDRWPHPNPSPEGEGLIAGKS
ncbi:MULTISPECIES: endonuclease domain-containing protein [unclassified Sphingobium]|uniref:endonuclease domain-containing protein n=1 Tax=unclassified Sphingobium TaxID=2611147 RepID=UPI0035A6EEAB